MSAAEHQAVSDPRADKSPETHIVVENLTMAYGEFVIQHDLNFTINRGDIFVIMGGSGCGKSTLLRHLIGLQAPARGRVLYSGESLWDAEPERRDAILRKTGVTYQGGGLWSSMTLLENVALPLEQYTSLKPDEIADLASLNLALVGLAGFEDYFPSEISGGMQKRAGLARAMALSPEVLLFDEPSAGLDPISSRLLDDLILELRDSLGATVVMVTHELASIFAVGDNSVFLDSESKTQIAVGAPRQLLDECPDPRVRRFLRRGEPAGTNEDTRGGSARPSLGAAP
jgi:phospholipid/cholesterol/gamma-HCH transport system ATP-binding protein